MNSSGEKKAELTSTFQISLRPVGDPVDELLANATKDERDVIAQLDRDSAMLIILGGPRKGARFLIDADVTKIGRAPENDIFLDDITVSRRHAELHREQKKFLMKDLGSLNGTYLNGSVVSEGDLRSGDELQIGKFRLHFFTGRRS